MIDVNSFLMRLLYTVGAGIVVFQLLGNNGMVSNLFVLTFLITSALWVIVETKEFDNNGLLALCIIIFAVVSVLLSTVFSRASISFVYIKKLIIFSMTIMFFRVASKMRTDEKTVSYIQNVVSVLSLILIFFYFTQNTEMHVFDEYVTDYLTFRFTNPNLTAMFLVCFTVVELFSLLRSRSPMSKLFHAVLMAFLFVFTMQTQARNSILSLAVFAVVFIIVQFGKKTSFKVSRPVSIAISVFPIVFALIYVFFLNEALFSDFFSFLASDGKGVDSRYVIWTKGFSSFFSSPIFGAYYTLNAKTGASQMHNTHVDILASYGIVVLVLVVAYLIRIINNRDKVYENKNTFMCVVAFISTLLLGNGEAALFSGGLGIYMWSGLFLLMANSAEQQELRGLK